MSPPDLAALLGEARDLTQRYQSGRPESFQAFADLASLILHQTVLNPNGMVRLSYGPRREEPVLGGAAGPTDPVSLTDGRYLRLTIQLFFEDTPQGRRVKVKMSSFQYQLDPEYHTVQPYLELRDRRPIVTLAVGGSRRRTSRT